MSVGLEFCHECGNELEFERWQHSVLQCLDCGSRRARQRQTAAQLRQIPPQYDWAALNSRELDDRVPGYNRIAGRLEPLLEERAIVFAGPAGSGKTSLACAMLRAVIQRALRGWETATFASATTLAHAPGTWGLGRGEPPDVARAMRAGLLVLDDLGQEARTELSAVTDVIYERHAQMRPMWITTGFSAEEITQRYGGGIARRVFEHATVIRLGADRG